MNKLDTARLGIEKIDQEMLDLFEKRMDLVKEVLAYKKENNLPIFQEKREKELIEKNLGKVKNQDYKDYYEEFFKQMLIISKKFQEDNI